MFSAAPAPSSSLKQDSRGCQLVGSQVFRICLHGLPLSSLVCWICCRIIVALWTKGHGVFESSVTSGISDIGPPRSEPNNTYPESEDPEVGSKPTAQIPIPQYGADKQAMENKATAGGCEDEILGRSWIASVASGILQPSQSQAMPPFWWTITPG